MEICRSRCVADKTLKETERFEIILGQILLKGAHLRKINFKSLPAALNIFMEQIQKDIKAYF